MKQFKQIASFAIILALCMFICMCAALFVLLIWKNAEAAWTTFVFGGIYMMMGAGQLD